MAEPWEWEEANLQSLVDNQASEGPELDFKECGALGKTDGKKRELSKDVSALANSAGGTLVYGIIEDKKAHTAAKLDQGYDPAEISHEWIEQVVNSNIQPRISGIRIKPVALANSSPGRVAFVVYVPQGSTAHQAADKRYYKRFNFESVPMEDYEIRDVMSRTRSPVVTLEFEIEDKTQGYLDLDGNAPRLPPISVYVVSDRIGDVCEFSQYHLFVPADVKWIAEEELKDATLGSRRLSALPSKTTRKGAGGSLPYLQLRFDFAARDTPLFPGERRPLGRLYQQSAVDLAPDAILWRSRCPRSEDRSGAVVFVKQSRRWFFEPVSLEALDEASGMVTALAP